MLILFALLVFPTGAHARPLQGWEREADAIAIAQWGTGGCQVESVQVGRWAEAVSDAPPKETTGATALWNGLAWANTDKTRCWIYIQERIADPMAPEFCTVLTHERGHAAGHWHHTAWGLMSANATTQWPPCEYLAESHRAVYYELVQAGVQRARDRRCQRLLVKVRKTRGRKHRQFARKWRRVCLTRAQYQAKF